MSRRTILSLAAVSGGLAFTGLAGAHAETAVPTPPPGPHVNENALKAVLEESSESYIPGTTAKIVRPLAAASLSTVDAFVAKWTNMYVDADGYYGAQCWDLWEQYCRSVIGCSGISTQHSPNPGYACGLWDGYATNGAATFFTKIAAATAPKKGDVAIWKYGQYPNYPYSHAAIVVGDAGNYVKVLSQNSSPALPNNPFPGMSTGPSIIQNLTKTGLAGYFRPRSLPGEQPSIGKPSISSPADVLAVDTAGALWIYPATGSGGLGARIKLVGNFSGMVTGWTVDWTGNGILDLVIKWNDGRIRLHAGLAQGGFAAPQIIGTGWTTIDIAPARWRSTDNRPGLIAKLSNGDLRYYPNASGGTMSQWLKIGSGWNGLAINALNFNGDAHADVIAQDPAGLLWLYPGKGTGAFGAKSRVGHGFRKTGLIAVTGFKGAGSKGLILRTSPSTLTYYPLSASGAFQTPLRVSDGFSNLRLLNSQ
ncbi:CHAP domain-containing protein [Arthrobacter sp. TMN-49]